MIVYYITVFLNLDSVTHNLPLPPTLLADSALAGDTFSKLGMEKKLTIQVIQQNV